MCTALLKTLLRTVDENVCKLPSYSLLSHQKLLSVKIVLWVFKLLYSSLRLYLTTGKYVYWAVTSLSTSNPQSVENPWCWWKSGSYTPGTSERKAPVTISEPALICAILAKMPFRRFLYIVSKIFYFMKKSMTYLYDVRSRWIILWS